MEVDLLFPPLDSSHWPQRGFSWILNYLLLLGNYWEDTDAARPQTGIDAALSGRMIYQVQVFSCKPGTPFSFSWLQKQVWHTWCVHSSRLIYFPNLGYSDQVQGCLASTLKQHQLCDVQTLFSLFLFFHHPFHHFCTFLFPPPVQKTNHLLMISLSPFCSSFSMPVS